MSNFEDTLIIPPARTRAANNHFPDTASTGCQGQVVRDKLTQGQANWYVMNISPNVQYAIGLIGAPSYYELFLVDTTFNGFTIPLGDTYSLPTMPSGKYYVVVQNTSGMPVATDYYSLYFGEAIKQGGYTGMLSTGLSFSFGTRVLQSGFWYSDAKTYAGLSSAASIPELSFITQLHLTSDGNGMYWAGFVKMITMYEMSTGRSYTYEQMGNTDLMYDSGYHGGAFPVNQSYLIQGRIQTSQGFIWRPNIRISYLYYVTTANLRFINSITL